MRKEEREGAGVKTEGTIEASSGDVIAERKLSQVRAAKLLGIDQPKVSALLRGKLDGFSIDRLFRFLNALGRDVEIVIRPARQDGEADTRVISAWLLSRDRICGTV